MLALALSSCALLPGGGPAPLDTFDLSAPAPAAAVAQTRRQVLVPEPAALKALDGQDIVIRSGPASIEVLRGAQWADRLPRVVQARLIEALQQSGRFVGVGRPGEGLAIDFQIVAEVRAFEVEVSGNGRARVALFVKLVNDRNGVVRASRYFEAVSPLAGRDNADYVAALDRAFNSAARDIVAWVASSV